ncbi:Ankyrin repeat domain containing protein [Pandoravirus neocaledonia]|uniref:Ankyrin repeat domain containing protein n=1 Tax=Pandoravirus neocaledonia TaxID=2107708 RepID=A0A2U7UDX2_9VIRU|nr:Ankyrin repeat domain containing protein [Pandoravirus neocaledonia]AVK76658.1 Ankyrin repeat domain containing protein [Pandoravirus neocaledonia]
MLKTAVRHGHATLVRWLIDGKYVTDAGMGSCHEAARSGHVECLALLEGAGCP